MSYRTSILGFLGAAIFLLPFSHLKLMLFGLPLYLPEAAVLLGLSAFGLGYLKKEYSLRSVGEVEPLLLAGIFLFFVGAVFSLLASPFSLTGLGMLKTWFLFPLLMAWVIWHIRPSDEERSFFLLTWLAATALAAFGVLLGGHFTYDERLVGWFLSPNYLAIFISPGLLLALFFLMERQKTSPGYFTLLLSSLGLLVALFLTRSYGVWIAALGSCFLMAFLSAHLWNKKNIWKIIAGLAILAALFFFLEHDNPKWQSLVAFGERSSMSSRIMIWQSAAKIIQDHPILGIGLGRFQEVYLEYQKFYPPYLEWAVPQPHNLFLAVWLQTGLIGLCGFSLILWKTFARVFQNKDRETGLFLGLMALYLIYGLFDTPYFKTDLAFAFWLVIALSVSQSKK